MSGESRVQVKLSDDLLRAEISVVTGELETEEQLRNALKQVGVTHGILEDVCSDIGIKLADPGFETSALVIARGDPAVPGLDGKLEIDVPEQRNEGTLRKDGSMDYRETSALRNVEPGEAVAHYVAPRPGTNGEGVDGSVIMAPSDSDERPVSGPGVKFDVQSGKYTAQRSGILSYVVDKSIDVLDFLELKGDVDFESGNLKVDSTVLIGGTVLQTFSVDANGDVSVQGKNCRGTIRSTANVVLQGGVTSTGGESITAEGDIHCHHANAATLTAGGTIHIHDHCMNSTLSAKNIHIDEGRGRVVGGELRAESQISVIEAGSPMGTPTRLAVADLLAEKAEIARLQQKCAANARMKGGETSPDNSKANEKLAKLKRELETKEMELLSVAGITVTGVAHAGTIIRMGSIEKILPDSFEGVRFHFDRNERSIEMTVS